MKIFLTSAYEEHQWLDHLIQLAGQDRVGRHQLADSPEQADAVLFVENAQFYDYTYRKVKRHPLTRRFSNKVFIYNEVDKPFGGMPGLYCSMPISRIKAAQQMAFPYLSLPNAYVKDIHQWTGKQDWPFAFVGSISHRLRKRVMALQSFSEGVKDTSEFNVWNASREERASQGRVFAEAMARSRFILCPRGIGTSSFRQFEAMQAARAPVIISDQWVAPPQVDWDFAISIRESDVEAIPEILAQYSHEAVDRGRAAREAWEKVYAPDVMFDTCAEAIEELLKTRPANSSANANLAHLLPINRWLTEVEVAARTTVDAFRQQSFDS